MKINRYVVTVESKDDGSDLRTDHHKISESFVPQGKMKTLKVIWKLLASKKYRWLFSETLKYAIRHHDSIRGTGSSEVVLFTMYFNPNEYWRP